MTIRVGNSANVTMNVDAGAYATVSMLNDVKKDIADIQDAIGLTSSKVYGVEVDLPNRKFTRLGAAERLTPVLALIISCLTNVDAVSWQTMGAY